MAPKDLSRQNGAGARSLASSSCVAWVGGRCEEGRRRGGARPAGCCFAGRRTLHSPCVKSNSEHYLCRGNLLKAFMPHFGDRSCLRLPSFAHICMRYPHLERGLVASAIEIDMRRSHNGQMALYLIWKHITNMDNVIPLLSFADR